MGKKYVSEGQNIDRLIIKLLFFGKFREFNSRILLKRNKKLQAN